MKKINLSLYCDPTRLEIMAPMTKEEYKQYLTDEDFDKDDYFGCNVTYFLQDSVREFTFDDSNEIDPYDCDTVNGINEQLEWYYEVTATKEKREEEEESLGCSVETSVKDEICYDIELDECKKIHKIFKATYGSIKSLPANSVTVVEVWECYKSQTDFTIELDEEENFDPEKVSFLVDDYDGCFDWKCNVWSLNHFDEIFQEDRLLCDYILYDGNLVAGVFDSDMGEDLSEKFAIHTDKTGTVTKIEKI